MFTNRDEVLEKALRIFAKMNYEKASQMEIARTCGLSKAGLTYYFPFKLDLFIAVADRYVFDTQHTKNKFNFTAGSLEEFIDQYVAGVENTRQRLVRLLDDGDNSGGCSVNFYYYHLLMQVRMYYPGVEQKILPYSVRTLNCGKLLLKRRKKAGKSGRMWMWMKRLRCSGRCSSEPPMSCPSFRGLTPGNSHAACTSSIRC